MRIYKIKVNGKTYEVKVMGVTEVEPTEVTTVKAAPAAPVAAAPAPVAAPAGNASATGKPVEAPMQGTILDVKVKVGDSVNEGDVLLILEAMKLENEVVATASGTVKQILVSKGKAVQSQEALIIVG